MNAQHKLWAKLAELLPDQHQALKYEYQGDLAIDRKHSVYRTWLRREQEALATLSLTESEPLYPSIKAAAQTKLARAQAWLAAHSDWQPESKTRR
ncbi:MAG: hypothetical protein WCJ76_08265 [Comamonadaceae bacterium]